MFIENDLVAQAKDYMSSVYTSEMEENIKNDECNDFSGHKDGESIYKIYDLINCWNDETDKLVAMKCAWCHRSLFIAFLIQQNQHQFMEIFNNILDVNLDATIVVGVTVLCLRYEIIHFIAHEFDVSLK